MKRLFIVLISILLLLGTFSVFIAAFAWDDENYFPKDTSVTDSDVTDSDEDAFIFNVNTNEYSLPNQMSWEGLVRYFDDVLDYDLGFVIDGQYVKLGKSFVHDDKDTYVLKSDRIREGHRYFTVPAAVMRTSLGFEDRIWYEENMTWQEFIDSPYNNHFAVDESRSSKPVVLKENTSKIVEYFVESSQVNIPVYARDVIDSKLLYK